MPSTTDHRMALEDAICACLDAGDSQDEVLEATEAAFESWKADNPTEPDNIDPDAPDA